MKIHLKQRYRGALTNEQWIAYGEYDASELPDGLAQYLVDNGHATVIEADSKPIARQRADKAITPDDVEALSNDEPEYKKEAYELPNGDTVALTYDTEEEREKAILSAEYEFLTGEAPPWNIKLETLRARVEELRDED